MRAELKEHRKADNWWNFTLQAMGMKILNSQEDLGLSKEDWQRMKTDLEEYRKRGHWLNFANRAMQMKILASPEVKIPPQGGLEVK